MSFLPLPSSGLTHSPRLDGHALKPLESLVSHDPVLKKRGALRVLEIGAGLGGNLQYVRRDIVYTNVDPNQEFGPIFLEEVKKNPKVGNQLCLQM
ncbi:hypothetical protein HPB49_026245 [Dermacentor silvarum]|nr:hypothetical protein HPB49_026245 [Dermacentor silvarum]